MKDDRDIDPALTRSREALVAAEACCGRVKTLIGQREHAGATPSWARRALRSSRIMNGLSIALLAAASGTRDQGRALSSAPEGGTCFVEFRVARPAARRRIDRITVFMPTLVSCRNSIRVITTFCAISLQQINNTYHPRLRASCSAQKKLPGGKSVPVVDASCSLA